MLDHGGTATKAISGSGGTDSRATLAGELSAGRARAEWCVDDGVAIVAMTRQEILRAIDHGRLDASTRVWRDGLECWTTAGEVPELADAFGIAPSPTPAPVATEAVSRRPRDVRDGFGGRRAAVDRGMRWVALGTLVGAVAVAVSLLAAQRPAGSEEHQDAIAPGSGDGHGAEASLVDARSPLRVGVTSLPPKPLRSALVVARAAGDSDASLLPFPLPARSRDRSADLRTHREEPGQHRRHRSGRP